MVGSIDPRCETVRGTHWPKKVAWLFGARVAETILASDPLRPHQQAGHMDASDPIRPEKLLRHGAVHIWVPAFAGTTAEDYFIVVVMDSGSLVALAPSATSATRLRGE